MFRITRIGRISLALVLIAAVIASGVWWSKSDRKTVVKSPAAVPVSAVRVAVRDYPVRISALGAAQAWQGVIIRPQVGGKLLRVAVQEGREVKSGDLVAEIDPVPYRAQLLQAQGALARDQAQLESARLDLGRYERLASQGTISRQQADTQAAVVRQLEGSVTVDRGVVANAEANLGYTRITAPLTGTVGVRLIDAGNIVSANDATGIVTINLVSPIAVTLSLPEGDYQRMTEASHGFSRPLVVEAFSQESGDLLDTGLLNVSDNHVDPTTATVQMKARFENKQRRLWPGQFLNIRVTLQTLHDVLVVPSSAVSQGPAGTYAYVVGPERRVTMQPINVSLNQGGFAVIGSGLKPDDLVVSDGQMSLQSNSSVVVRAGAEPAGAAPP